MLNLGDGMFERLLTCASHDQQISFTHRKGEAVRIGSGPLITEGRFRPVRRWVSLRLRGTQEKPPSGTYRKDRDNGVRSKPPQSISVVGNAVFTVSVVGQRNLFEAATVPD